MVLILATDSHGLTLKSIRENPCESVQISVQFFHSFAEGLTHEGSYRQHSRSSTGVSGTV